jgi:hypothetical protein
MLSSNIVQMFGALKSRGQHSNTLRQTQADNGLWEEIATVQKLLIGKMGLVGAMEKL